MEPEHRPGNREAARVSNRRMIQDLQREIDDIHDSLDELTDAFFALSRDAQARTIAHVQEQERFDE